MRASLINGAHRHMIATPPQGCKDANDLLRADGVEAVRAMIGGAKAFEAGPAYVSWAPS